jgi:Na+:H+ antiporter, NhaA family
MISSKLYKEFFESEKAGGFILLFATVISLLLANSGIASSYLGMWKIQFAGHSLAHWINDGLMVIFFLMIGLELERETRIGELSKFKDAMLPVFAAIGGMIFPAGIYLAFNYGTETQSGISIPMATDIAFALGILSLLGKRVPTTLKIFLTALAVVDDLGAIVIIALFYTKTLIFTNLLLSLSVFAVLLLFNRFGIKNLIVYLTGGVLMWYFMHNSGVHATISGVLLAFAIPFDRGSEQSPSTRLLHFLHKPVAFIILPLFALANTAIVMNTDFTTLLRADYSLGIAAGLLIGKPLGIIIMSYIAIRSGIGHCRNDLKWSSIIGAGFLAGIGFTMSVFITLLAFDNETVINNAKLMIVLTSIIAGAIGFFILRSRLKEEVVDEE